MRPRTITHFFDDGRDPVVTDLAPSFPLVMIRAEAIADVKAEAQRRILAIFGAQDLSSGLVKQMNLMARGVELTDKKTAGTRTPQEDAEAASLQAVWDQVKAIRNASNLIEADVPSATSAAVFDYMEGMASDPRWGS
jgi:hypothetical protein